MNILVIGSGGREYSIGLRLLKDEEVDSIFFAPGNGATNKLGINLDYKDFEDLTQQVISNNIELTIVGPEAPLVDGIVDFFEEKSLKIFGPNKQNAQVEGSKVYMKDFLSRHNIVTAKYIETSSQLKADEFIETLTAPIVVKADGLCGGKGVIIAQTKSEAKKAVLEMLDGTLFGDAGERVIVEEFLDGYELSLFVVSDGTNYVTFPAAQDHKRLKDGDKGPNTGGMGAYAPTPLVDKALYETIEKEITIPSLEGFVKDGSAYKGVLFIGIMVVNGKPKVLEYNVRFGDPECEILMPLLQSSAKDLFLKSITGKLDEYEVKMSEEVGICVVLASKDYPYKSSTPTKITVKENKSLDKKSHIVYAGVKKEGNDLLASGGRVMLSLGFGKDIKVARHNAYEQIKNIQYKGMQFRQDIAYQAL